MSSSASASAYRVVFIPLGVGFLWVAMGALRWRHLVAALVVMAVIVGFLAHQIYWFKLNKAYPAYRIENLFYSWNIAKQHPILGIGLRAPRDQFLEAYQLEYPYGTKEQFRQECDRHRHLRQSSPHLSDRPGASLLPSFIAWRSSP